MSSCTALCMHTKKTLYSHTTQLDIWLTPQPPKASKACSRASIGDAATPVSACLATGNAGKICTHMSCYALHTIHSMPGCCRKHAVRLRNPAGEHQYEMSAPLCDLCHHAYTQQLQENQPNSGTRQTSRHKQYVYSRRTTTHYTRDP